jgi:hypothetical protein
MDTVGRVTEQQAGDAATQIGAVRGNVIQHVRQRLGFWGFLAASIVSLGVLFFSVFVVEKLWPSQDVPVGPVPPYMPSASSAMAAVPGFDFAPGATHYGGLAQPVLARGAMAPAVQFDAGLAEAQLRSMGATLMQYVNSVEIQSVLTHDTQLAASVFAGPALENVQAHIAELQAFGLHEQPVLEGGQVLEVRLVSQEAWGGVVQIDTCETWSRSTYDAAGFLVDSQPRHAVPQTVTIQLQNGQVRVTAVDFDVAFPGCL